MAEKAKKVKAFVTSVHCQTGRTVTVDVEEGYCNENPCLLAVQKAAKAASGPMPLFGVAWVLLPDGDAEVVSILRCVDHPTKSCKVFVGVSGLTPNLRQAVDSEIALVKREHGFSDKATPQTPEEFADRVTETLKNMMGVA